MTTSEQHAPDPADWRVVIRQRLVTAGRERSWSELWPSLVSARLDLLDAIAGVSEQQARWKPSANDWSIEETLRHQLVSSRGVIGIIEALAVSHAPGEDAVYDSPGDLTAHEFAPPFEGSFAALRADFLAHSIDFASLPLRLPAEPDRERAFEHIYFGPLTSVAWFAFQRIHDGAHLRQIREILEAPGYPAA